MKVLLTIWISAVLIQEVTPGTLVRLPRHTAKLPALVETEYEAKYEQTGQHGNETSGLFSGKQEIVHDNCSDNWNVFADKCAALIKDLVASLASTVSSRPGDATKLQLQIKNTFRHFDNSHNCTCLNDTAKIFPTMDLSRLLNNITINTIAPTANDNRNSTGANNIHESSSYRDGKFHSGNNGLKEGIVGLGSNSVGDDGNGSSDGHDNNFGTQNSHTAGVSRKANTALKNANFSPESEGSEAGSNSRRQAEYPQVSWQPGNKTRHSQVNHGGSNNINRSRYPFIVTPQPNSVYESPAPATYSDGNNLPNGGNGFGSNGQTNSNASPAGASGGSGIPLRIQTLPATNTYNSEPASDSHYKAAVRVPSAGSHNSAHTAVTGVPPALDDRHDAALVPAIPAPGGHNSKNGYSLIKAPVTGDSYDPKPVPVHSMTDGLSHSQSGTTLSNEPRGPKFLTNNSPNSGSYSNKPQVVLSTSTNETPENSQTSDSHAFSKNHIMRPVAEINQPVSSLTREDFSLDSTSGTPNTKPVLTIGKPEVFSAHTDKRVGVPLINSDSNIPETREPESQWGTTNPLPNGRKPNPSSANVKPGNSAIPEVLPTSINDESEHATFAPTTNKFSDTITLPLDHIPPAVYVKPPLPEADSHKLGDPLEAEHALNNPSDRTAAPVTVTPSSQSQNFDPAVGSGSENVYGKPQTGAPVTAYPVYVPATMSPLGSNTDIKPEENSGSNGNDNSGKYSTEEEDCEENDAEDAEKTPATVVEHSGQSVSLQDPGIPQSSAQVGDSNAKNGIGQSHDLKSISNTHPDNEEDEEDCDENTDSDPVTNVGTGNDATPVIVPPVHPVSKISDEVVQGSVPASEDDEDCDEDEESSNDATDPITASQVKPVSKVTDPVVQTVQENVPVSDNGGENTGSANHATIPVAVSPVQPVPKVSDPVVQAVQGSAPGSTDDGENVGSGTDANGVARSSSRKGCGTNSNRVAHTSSGKGSGIDPNSVAHTGSSVGVSPVQPVPTVSDPVVQEVQENAPVPEDEEDCDEDEESNKDATAPVAVSPVQSVPTVLDPAVQEVRENIPAPDDGEDCDENTESSNDATAPVAVSPVQPIPMVSDPLVQGNVPASHDETTGSVIHPNSAAHTSSGRGSGNDATIPVAVSPVQPIPTVSDPVVQTGEENAPVPEDDEDCDEDEESNKDATAPVAVSPVQPVVSPVQSVPTVSDPVVQVVPGNVPAPGDGGENTGSGIHPSSVAHTSSNTGTANDEISPVAMSPVQPVSTASDPVVQEVQENAPVPEDEEDCDEDEESNKDATAPVAVSPVQPIPTVSDPVVQTAQGNVPVPNDGGESTGSANHATIPEAVSPVKPVLSVSEPAGVSLQSGDSPQSNTGSGVEGVQTGVNQPITLNVTPLPYTHLPDAYTPISPISEGQSGNPGSEDSALYKPTTFQTTAADPTSPQSILIPTESTGGPAHASTAKQSPVRPSTSHLSKESDDEDEDEDCCSCESCTEDEITDPKRYKENACKNLEEARRELKAIFDKIKKKLKCGRKALSTISSKSSA